jgi:hypothetical protein
LASSREDDGILLDCHRNFLAFRRWNIRKALQSCRQTMVGRPPTTRRTIMGKERHGTKEAKKQAVLTLKEKKVAKQVKKHEKSIPHPLITH